VLIAKMGSSTNPARCLHRDIVVMLILPARVSKERDWFSSLVNETLGKLIPLLLPLGVICVSVELLTFSNIIEPPTIYPLLCVASAVVPSAQGNLNPLTEGWQTAMLRRIPIVRIGRAGEWMGIRILHCLIASLVPHSNPPQRNPYYLTIATTIGDNLVGNIFARGSGTSGNGRGKWRMCVWKCDARRQAMTDPILKVVSAPHPGADRLGDFIKTSRRHQLVHQDFLANHITDILWEERECLDGCASWFRGKSVVRERRSLVGLMVVSAIREEGCFLVQAELGELVGLAEFLGFPRLGNLTRGSDG